MPSTKVQTPGITDSSVTTSKIADSSVTNPKLSDSSVSGAKLNGNQTGTAPIYGVRAWALFNGFDGQIISSGNISDVRRLAKGQYRVTFNTSMIDNNYAVISTIGINDTDGGKDNALGVKIIRNTMTNNAFTIWTSIIGGGDSGDSFVDYRIVSIMIMR